MTVDLSFDLSMQALQLAYNNVTSDRAAKLMMEAIEEDARPRCPECHSADEVEVRGLAYEYADVIGTKDDARYKLLVKVSDDHEKRYSDAQPEDGQPQWVFFHASCSEVWEIDADIELEWV